MEVPSRPFACCGTNRSWLLGIATFFIVLSAVVMLGLLGMIALGFTASEILAGSFIAKTPNAPHLPADIAILAIGALDLIIQIIGYLLPFVAEDKNKPRLLVYFRVYLYCAIVFQMLFGIFSMIAGIRGIFMGTFEILFRLTFTTILIVVTNRRYEELVENSNNSAKGGAPQSVNYTV